MFTSIKSHIIVYVSFEVVDDLVGTCGLLLEIVGRIASGCLHSTVADV